MSALKSGLAALAIGVAALSGIAGTSRAAETPQTHAGVPAAARYAIDIGGVPAGWLVSATGGHATTDVATNRNDGIKKQPVVQYGDIATVVGSDASRTVLAVIKDTLDLKSKRYTGSITSIDAAGNATSVLDFGNAVVSEIGFPAFDAASKNEVTLTLKYSPEYTRYKKGSGKVQSAAPVGSKVKPWVASNFRLTIDGVDCSKVTKVGAITVKQKAGGLQVSNLTITLAESDAKPFIDWQRAAAVAGGDPQKSQKNGSLAVVSADGKQVLLMLSFHGLGIFKLAADKAEANDDKIKRMTAELVVERMEFKYENF